MTMTAERAARREEALALAAEVGPSEAARRLELPAGTVKRWARDAGLKMGGKRPATPAEKAEALSILVRLGMAEAEKVTGWSRVAIYDWAKAAGLSTGTHPSRRRERFDHNLRACAGMGTRAFYADDPAEAIDVCRSKCLVMEGCLAHALRNREEHGVWGGCTEADRESLLNIWDGQSTLVGECERCERAFVRFLDGSGHLCPSCRDGDVDG